MSPPPAAHALADNGRGRQAASPTQVPPVGWKDVLLRTWRESSADNVGIVAAGIAFYAFLALVPLLGATVLTYGLFTNIETVGKHAASLTSLMPADVARLIGEQLANVVQTSSGKKGLGILVALGVALFGARSAAGAVITALNIAYEEEERRGFIRVNLLALAMTAGAVLTVVLGMLGVASLGFLGKLLPSAHPLTLLLSRVLGYLGLALAAGAAATLLYRYGPSRRKACWRWVTPGSVLFAVAWVLLTLGFGFYVANFGNYGATYGSLGAVVVFLTWMYLSAYALLFGAELNSELEHQTARDTTPGPEKPLGARGAWAADNVADGPAG